MPKKMKSDAREFNFLKKIGLEFQSPQDEFSYQPDSGSTADGDIGKQEYRIDVDFDAQARTSEHFGTARKLEDPTAAIPGESSYSQNHRNPEEEIEKKPIGGDDMDIFELVRDRFKHHPRLNQTQISLRVKSGAVTLRGEVSTDDAKQVAIDIVESLPGVTEVRNELSVNLGMR
jgi:osmotically-inducible protein OsmY